MDEKLYNKLLDVITFCHLQMDDRRDKLDEKYMPLYYELQSEYKKEDVCQVAKDLIYYKERNDVIKIESDEFAEEV